MSCFEERRVEVQPAILIDGHRSQPRPFHGDKRHHLMRHVGHSAGGEYSGFGEFLVHQTVSILQGKVV
jgi:hypothetical protein